MSSKRELPRSSRCFPRSGGDEMNDYLPELCAELAMDEMSRKMVTEATWSGATVARVSVFHCFYTTREFYEDSLIWHCGCPLPCIGRVLER